jgi:GDP-L-fucose synthase
MEKVDAKDLYEKGISHLNIGTGKDLTILELAKMIADITDFDGKIVSDTSKPDGTPRKLLDVSRINALGWKYTTDLREGIIKTYNWFLTKFE